MKGFSSAVAVLAATPSLLVQGRIQATESHSAPASVLKNVRSLLHLGGNADGAGPSDPRELEEDPSTLRCFYECINQGMSADECVEYIETLLGGSELPGHEIPNLQIKISPPRTVDQVKDTYWMFGIPTNIYGEVDCNLNGGNIVYPWAWQVDGVGRSIPEVPCAGLDANACCDKVLATMTEEGIPLADDNGNCFSCWAHQEPLEPTIGAGGDVAYLEHSTADDGTCEANELAPFDVQAADAAAGTAISKVVSALDELLASNPAQCADFAQLHRDLILHARANTQAMSQVPGLLCGFVCGPDGTFTITEELQATLLFIRLKLTTIEIKSDENCIIIYTDRQGNVVEPPKIGGSRDGLDVDLDDPDCDEPPTITDGNSPVASPVAVTCSGANEVPNETGSECVCADLHVHNPATGDCELCHSPTTYSNGECVCESPFAMSEGTCMCPEGTVPDELAGCKKCDSPMTATNGECVCSAPFAMNEGSCICAQGTVSDNVGGCKKCEYPTTYSDLNGGSCVCEAPFGTIEGNCVCAKGTVPDGQDGCKECDSPMTYTYSSADGGSCECGGDYEMTKQGVCGCKAPTVMTTAGGCEACKAGSTYSNGECVEGCPSGTQFDYNSQSCKCESNKVPSPDGDGSCVDCANGSKFDWNSKSCQCPWGQVKDENGACVPCATGTQYNADSKTCECTQWGYVEQEDGSCTQCQNPWTFDQNSRSCVCTKYGYSLNSDGECVTGTNEPPTPSVECDGETVSDGKGGCKSCVDPEVYSASNGGECVCKAGFKGQSGSCVIDCTDETVPDGEGGCKKCADLEVFAASNTGGECVCQEGLERKADDTCGEPKVYAPGDCGCALPAYLSNFALITEGDANVAPKTIYKGIAIGGTLSKTKTSYNTQVSSNFGNTKSYVNAEAGYLNLDYKGQGVVMGSTLADAGINMDELRCIAKKAASLGDGRQNNYNVIVLTQGGTYNLFDFIKDGQGEDNGKTLVIFNTSEDVTLTNASGRQFGPSVLAPFSKVNLDNSGYVDGWIVSKTFVSTGSSDQMHADAYTGPLVCNEVEEPSGVDCAGNTVSDGAGGCKECGQNEAVQEGQCVCNLPFTTDESSGECVPMQCFTPSPSKISPILGTVQPDQDYCENPDKEDKSLEPEAKGNYKVDFQKREVNDLGNGQFTTTFFYEACTAARDSNCFPNYEGKSNTVMSDVVVQIHGQCDVVRYDMYDADGVTKGNDFPGQSNTLPGDHEFLVGRDQQTCLNGFKWDIGWDRVSNNQCKNGLCRTISVTLAGIVPMREGLTAVQPSGYFVTYETMVPDCDFECGDECYRPNDHDKSLEISPPPLGTNDGVPCTPEYPRKTNDQTGKAGGDNYLIQYEGRDVKTMKDGRTATEFTYTACTAQPIDCGGDGPNNLDWWVSDIAIEMCGACTVRRYDMFDEDGVSTGVDFPGQVNSPDQWHEEWFVGADIDTCLVGFKWDLDWKVVEKKGCSTKPTKNLTMPNDKFCRKISVTIDGDVPTTEGFAAVQPSYYMARYPVQIPDCCSVCPGSAGH